jgi:ABC-type uncharacterized transport system involved in gliding motility auxiliary subunit
MRALGDTMVVTAYFTDGMPPPYSSYARYIRDMLEEYRAASNGKLAFEFIDPLKEESDEDKIKKKEVTQDMFGAAVRAPTSVESELMNLGIQPVEIRVFEDDQQQTKRAYMGLMIRYQGKHEVIPIVQDFATFEKDMTVRMRKLIRKKQPVIGLVNDVGASSISKFRQLIGQVAEVKDLSAESFKEPLQVDALLVMGSGKSLGDEAIQSVEAFLASGKNVALFIDQHEFDPQTLREKSPEPEHKENKLVNLLQRYGITVGDSMVADVQCREILVQDQNMAFGVRYPFFPVVTKLDQSSPVTYGLSGTVLPFASPITLGKDVQGKMLAQSSEKSWVEVAPFNTDPNRKWQAQDIQVNGPHGLVAEIKDVGAKPNRMLVAGTSAFAWDQFLTPENQTLALSSVDYLLADDVMLSLHSRSFSELPLDPDVSDSKRNVIKYANMLGVPALLALYGIVRWRRRESRRRKITLDSIR